MKIYYQDLQPAILKIEKHFQEYPTASISAMFRKLRNFSQFSMIGDYPILATITSTLLDMGIPLKKSTISRAAKQSEELKGQTLLLKQLLSPQQTLKKSIKTHPNRHSPVTTYKSLSQMKKPL